MKKSYEEEISLMHKLFVEIIIQKTIDVKYMEVSAFGKAKNT